MSERDIERAIIWNKSGGKCWYCGCDLPEKGWHEDHFEPIRRGVGTLVSGMDNLDNRVPSCAPCNLFKGVYSVEEFRLEILQQVARARNKSVNFRTAERFGLIEATLKPVVFWFETQDKR